VSKPVYLQSFIRPSAVYVDGFSVVNIHTNFSMFFDLLFKTDSFDLSPTYLVANQQFNNDEFNHIIFCLPFISLQHLFSVTRSFIGAGTEIEITEKLRKILDSEPYDEHFKEPLWHSKFNRF
jgi:hypothetical protein